MAGGQADVSVESGAKTTQKGDGRLGAAFLDALNFVIGHRGSCGELRDGQAKGGADVVQGLAE